MTNLWSNIISYNFYLIRKAVFTMLIGLTIAACSDKTSSITKNDSDALKNPVSEIMQKYPGHLPDGFEGNRRIRPGNYIQLDILATTRNFINIWLPEYCTYKGLKKPFFLLSEGANLLKVDTTSTGGISLSTKVGDGLKMTGTAEEFQYGLYLTLKYHNISNKFLEDITSNVCVQLTAAPDFRDPELTRTYWYNNGKWDSTFTKNKVVQEGIVRCEFFRSGLNDGKSLPLVVVDSPNSDYTIGLIFKKATMVEGNYHGSTSCIHSDGGSYDIEPGGTALKEGLLIIHPEGKEAVLKIATEFYHGRDQ